MNNITCYMDDICQIESASRFMYIRDWAKQHEQEASDIVRAYQLHSCDEVQQAVVDMFNRIESYDDEYYLSKMYFDEDDIDSSLEYEEVQEDKGILALFVCYLFNKNRFFYF